MKSNDREKQSLFSDLERMEGPIGKTSSRRRDAGDFNDFALSSELNQARNRFNREIKGYGRQLEALKKATEGTVEEFDKKFKLSEADIASVKKENVAFRAKQIEVIGIMVALFTFISIQVQIFTNVTAELLFPISMFFFAALLLLISVMSIVNMVRVEDIGKRFYIPVVSLVVISVGLITLSLWMYIPVVNRLDACRSLNNTTNSILTKDDLSKIASGDEMTINKVRVMQLKAEVMGCK